ncbi:MAG TPA: hypothetical protein DHW36_18490, partial [Thalassospira sp.]|nr:hypothetical protein [Thalassospira sp.]
MEKQDFTRCDPRLHGFAQYGKEIGITIIHLQSNRGTCNFGSSSRPIEEPIKEKRLMFADIFAILAPVFITTGL